MIHKPFDAVAINHAEIYMGLPSVGAAEVKPIAEEDVPHEHRFDTSPLMGVTLPDVTVYITKEQAMAFFGLVDPAVLREIGERCHGTSYLLGNDIHAMVLKALPSE